MIQSIKDGAKLLIKHIYAGHKIFIQVDSDCDGYTSAALLINYLNRLFPGFVQNNISYRFHETKAHGIIFETIPKDVKLVIAPDSSSNDYEVHQQLYEADVDVLVIDHHEAERVSEYACVINNQLCDYPTKSLSGVGMVYKFCSYIDALLNVSYADEYLDLVSLGLIADMMDMRDFETKYFIEAGIKVDAIDGSEELCRIASEYTGIKVNKMLFQELNVHEKYDGIWACSSILHLPRE